MLRTEYPFLGKLVRSVGIDFWGLLWVDWTGGEKHIFSIDIVFSSSK